MAFRTEAPSGMVTFMFTDMEGSSPAWDQHGTAMSMAQEQHDEILRTAIAASNGYVFATGGDGMAAAFASAHEALTAAVAAQRSLTAEPWPEPLAIRVRVGMHTGEAIERDGNYFGPDVIRAARLMSLVDGGRVVCSRATREAVQDRLPSGMSLLPVGSVRLKGLSAPEEVFAVSGPGLHESGQAVASPSRVAWAAPRPLNRLVGREAEIDEIVGLLMERWLVTITGIGGVGKTRLASGGGGANAREVLRRRRMGRAGAALSRQRRRTGHGGRPSSARAARRSVDRHSFGRVGRTVHARRPRQLRACPGRCRRSRDLDRSALPQCRGACEQSRATRGGR